jgi:hypothetical protein
MILDPGHAVLVTLWLAKSLAIFSSHNQKQSFKRRAWLSLWGKTLGDVTVPSSPPNSAWLSLPPPQVPQVHDVFPSAPYGVLGNKTKTNTYSRGWPQVGRGRKGPATF